jgi:WD40 repeat protein
VSVVAAVPLSPYKGLAAFEDSDLDALLFFGREREREVIVANLLASKLTVLYGPSGVGKSSILRASVARRLREVAPDAEVTIVDEWSASADLPAPLVESFVILDQFEEYFLYHDEGPLLDRLPVLLGRPGVHVLLALREDQLSRLDAFQARIPYVFSNRLRLDHLDLLSARAAIVGPLDRWNEIVEAGARVGVETAFVDAVLEQVDSGDGTVEAPYLQLVLERVWEEERESGSQVLRLETLERLGGARSIVSAHLERALGALPPREAAIATSALKFLVTSSRTKISHSFGDLVGYTAESPVALQAVLERLAAQRILRSLDTDEEGRRYEIFHDVLAEPVLEWRRGFEAQAAVERERRRHRRLIAIAVVAAVLAALMAVFSVWAFAQRSEASKQRREAQLQADNAIGQKRKAQLLEIQALADKERATKAKKAADLSAARAKRAEKVAKDSEAAAKQNAARAKASEANAKASESDAKASAAAATHSSKIAQKNKALAEQEKRVAEREARNARTQARRAKVGELVATSNANLEVDPEVSIRAALAAAVRAASSRVEDALRSALVAFRVRGILLGGGGPVNSAAFNPDGSLVATGTQGGLVRLFRTDTHALVHSIQAGSPVAKVVFSPDGRTLAAATQDGRALLYDVDRGSLLRTFPHGGAVLALAFGGNGRYLVTGSADRTLRVWDAASGDLLHAVVGAAPVSLLALNPAGTIAFALTTGDAVGRLYDVAAGAQIGSVQQQGEIVDATFNGDGSLLATAGRRNTYVWEAGSWSLLHLLTGHTATVTDVAFSGDGRIVSGSADSGARIYDVATGTLIKELTGQHQQRLSAVAFSPDQKQLATASADRTARIWPSPIGVTPDILAGHTDSVTLLKYSPDGRLLLTASTDGTARLWDTTEPTFTSLGRNDGPVATVQFSPDGRSLVSASADGTARIWNDGGFVRALQHGGPVTRASFVGNDRVLTASEDGTARLWRVEDGSVLATFPHGAPVRGVAYAGGGVVTGGDDAVVKMWNADGSLRWSQPNGTPVTDLVASDGVVATAGADGTARLWNEADGRLLHVLSRHTARIGDLAFSPDGKLLATASDDTTGRVWNVKSGRPVSTLVGHRFRLTSIVFSPDGRLVLTASVDGDARLWRPATGAPVRTLRFHEATVSQAAFSADGRWIVTSGPADAGLWLVRDGSLLLHIPALGGGPMRATAFSPATWKFAIGLTNGGVLTYRCGVCGTQPALAAIARARLSALRSR